VGAAPRGGGEPDGAGTDGAPGSARGAERPPAPHLLGIDADPRVLAAARANLDAAGHVGVRLHAADSLEFDLGSLGARQGLIVGNLPYGVRLGDAAKAAALTRRFLSRLGQGGSRWRFALLTSDAARVAGHPDVRDAAVTATVSGGLRVYVVTGSVEG
jgi:23S rRNA G2445 N2-methylase RlmL